MDTKKIAIKQINPQGRGATVYLSYREREHIGVDKGGTVIIDRSVPQILRIMSVDTMRSIMRRKNG